MKNHSITVVLPAHNEAPRLENSIIEIERILKGSPYEIIISEDGSTDGTDKIAASMASRNKKIIHLHSDERKGKGKAIKDAFKISSGDIISFMDVDLASDINDFPRLIETIENGADIAIGSRHLPESKVERSFRRAIFSKGYNFLAELLFNAEIKDLQCGFKAFHKNTLPILLSAKNDGFLWDTEVLVLAKRKGFKIVEVPITWREGGKSKVKLLKDSFKILYSLTKFKKNQLFKNQ